MWQTYQWEMVAITTESYIRVWVSCVLLFNFLVLPIAAQHLGPQAGYTLKRWTKIVIKSKHLWPQVKISLFSIKYNYIICDIHFCENLNWKINMSHVYKGGFASNASVHQSDFECKTVSENGYLPAFNSLHYICFVFLHCSGWITISFPLK